ncbi:MAG: molybdopterin-binding protein [Clostridium sp.]|uniref:molybdopterin-binding protein n=1 Tax=Clostridium sp. TaxID=1506 RepID=UPI002FCB0705
MIKKVKVEEAVGMVLAHDMTKIVPGEFKGARFKKGHIVKANEIDELKSMGKNHIFILELDENMIHEEEAADRIAKAAYGVGIKLTEPSEGKVNFLSKSRGLLKINLEALMEINQIEGVVLATLHTNTLVDEGKLVAGAKLIPLICEKDKIEQVEKICEKYGHVVSIKPVHNYKVGVVVTGTEVYEGIITDKFGPLLKAKADDYGCTIVDVLYSRDDESMIKGCIDDLLSRGCEIIITSGGMSVDPDDLTPSVIREVADEVVTYGSPVIPGAMFMIAYKGDIPIVGIPACGMFFKITVFDLVFKRLIAGDRITKRDMAELAHGGICQNCTVCHYPVCTFGN